MDRLSEAGRLYLKDYYILNEAQKDVFAFFNRVQDAIYQNMSERRDELPTINDFTWKTWFSKANPGRISIWPEPIRDISIFRKGKEELSLICRDARHDNNLASTDAISLIITSVNTLRRELKNIDNAILSSAVSTAAKHEVNLCFTKRTNFYNAIPINLDDAIESAETVTEVILNYCIAINDFITVLIKKQ